MILTDEKIAPKIAQDWPAFHHQLGVSLLATSDLRPARQSLQRAWEKRQDALTAKAMARLVDATGVRMVVTGLGLWLSFGWESYPNGLVL